MDFETYRDNIIQDFIEDCICCGSLIEGETLNTDQIAEINNRFESHRKCFELEYESSKNEAMELIVSCIYGDSVSASIDCLNCNEVIIDDEILFMGDEK